MPGRSIAIGLSVCASCVSAGPALQDEATHTRGEAAAIPVNGGSPINDADDTPRQPKAPNEPTHVAPIEALERLSSAPAGSLTISDIEDSFRIKLVRSSQQSYGEKYINAQKEDKFQINLFILPSQGLNLQIKTPYHHEDIEKWRTLLTERKWIAEPPISHPFIMDSYRRDGRQIRLEHDGFHILSISVFGLNTPKSE